MHDVGVKYKLIDFFDLDELQKLQNAFSKATGVASIITEPDGTPLTESSGFCRFCSEIVRNTEIGSRNCRLSDSIIGSPKKDGPRIQQCLSGGLIDAGASIMVGDHHIGNWLIGQVLNDDHDIDELLQYADEIGVAHDVYMSALNKVVRMPKQKFESICEFLFLNAQQLSKLAMENIIQKREIEKRKLAEDELTKININLEHKVLERTNIILETSTILEETNSMLEETTSGLEEANVSLEEVNATLEEEIKERLKAEEEIRQLNIELESKVLIRTQQLKEANEELMNSHERLKDQYFELELSREIIHQDEKNLRYIIENMLSSFSYHKVITDSFDRPIDYTYIEVNSAFESLMGLKKEDIIGRRVLELFPNMKAHLIETFGNVAITGIPVRYERHVPEQDKWFNINVYSPQKGFFVVMSQDITERKRAETIIKETNSELEKIVHTRTEQLLETNKMLEETNAMLEETSAGLEEANAAMEEANATLEEEVTERQKAEEEIKQLNAELEQKVLERTQQLHESVSVLETTFDSIDEGVLIVDKAGKVLGFNKRYVELWSIPDSLIVSREYKELLTYVLSLMVDPEEFLRTVAFADRNPKKHVHQVVELKDGRFFERYTQPKIADNEITGKIWCTRDITERHKAEQRMKYLGSYDAMTGFLNRHMFELKLNELQTNMTEKLGIIICDIDGLKFINDTFGHQKGDMHIINSANLIKGCFPNNEFIYRIGGDEFVIILLDTTNKELENGAESIRAAINSQERMDMDLMLNISVGFDLREDVAIPVEKILQRADNNMYKEKLYHNRSRRSSIVKTMAKMLEVRDFITEGHAQRIKELMVKLAKSMGIPEHKIADIALFAELHDIGKNGISDQILLKKASLSSEERAEMQTHSEIGYRIAVATPELDHIADWILKHHEWWDGAGYPLKLKGEEIPLECRLLSIVDAYDAMTNDRPYREALPHDSAIEELKRCAGTQFDPLMVEVFVNIVDLVM